MVCSLLFSLSSKCSLFHNSNVFSSCIIHILYKGCAKFKKKNNFGTERLIVFEMEGFIFLELFLGHTVTFPCVRTRTSLEMCAGIVILYCSYNKSQQVALFLNFSLVKNSAFFGQTYCS